jgi:hypothetical protein
MGAIKINISLQDTIDEFQLTQQQTESLADSCASALTLEIYRQWVEEAKGALNKTRDQYISSLLMADIGIGAKSIVLVGKFANMLENGVSPFDMKEGFKNSSKVKFNKKGGWYLTIPFRWATPSANGFSSAFTGVMPMEIYDIVKNFKASDAKQTTPGNSKVNSPNRLQKIDVPTPYDLPKTRAKIEFEELGAKKVFDEYVHKSSYFEGMTRDEKKYEIATQGSYSTFRRVGQNSEDLAWIHKGLTTLNLAQKAVQATDSDLVVNNEVDRVLSTFGF